ncbi:hypothetical protein FHT32_000308 [Variovorax sp. SG517]|uniref:hypothetical protein n=1 Tax=Variovorax sp. SG517 TaxID=2587117 RepID=UPI00159E49A3|nr:hypothetical protein [Variovorax sp. SG517]NVM86685.1 hypothetical protein [Variovorax sp. SG517]
MSSPAFSRSIQVTQIDASGIWPILLLCTAYSVLMFAGAAWILDPDATGWRIARDMAAMVVLFALWLVGLVVVVRGWLWVEAHWLPSAKRRAKLFSGRTQVDAGEAGFCVQGLGHVDWIDVLAIEGIPDSDNYLIVHTRPFRKLLLTVSVDELAPVISHYLDRRSSIEATRWGKLQSRAMVFCWRCFRAWIWAGYALAGAAGIALLLNSGDAGFVKTAVGLCVLVPMVAWLVWAIPISQISTFSPSRVRAFELEGTRLHSTDGEWQFDLRRARISRRRVSGIGYEFTFLAIRPESGKGLDLILEGGADQEALLDALNDRGLLPLTNPEL